MIYKSLLFCLHFTLSELFWKQGCTMWNYDKLLTADFYLGAVICFNLITLMAVAA